MNRFSWIRICSTVAILTFINDVLGEINLPVIVATGALAFIWGLASYKEAIEENK